MAGEPRQRRRVLLGGLLMLGLFACAMVIFFMDHILTMFDREYDIFVVLPGTTGVIEDSPVWVSGREVGVVSSIGFMPAGTDTTPRIVLNIRLPVSVQSQVRRDSEIRLTSVSLISEKVVDIVPGSAAAPALAHGDTLRQEARLSPMQLAGRAEIVKAGLDTVLAELRTYGPAVRARMLETERAFAGLDAVMVEARRLQSDMSANPGLALFRDPAFEASLRRTRTHAAELPIMIEQLRQNTGAASEVRAALARLQARADSLSVQLAAAEAALMNPNGTLGRMQQDTAITRAINAARAELDALIADMRSNPLRYVF